MRTALAARDRGRAAHLARKGRGVPDDVWNEAARHYSEQQLSALLLNIALTNVFNRFNVATRQIAGEWKGK
jgi:alkylhydroperoxidase family enzyme